MKERPILFSAPMARAILAGRKTQTRRIARVPKSYLGTPGADASPEAFFGPCPYGVPGNRLWVRETWAPHDELAHRCGTETVFYDRADDERRYPTDGRWHPSIHMPRVASRITLEVAEIRVERLRAITTPDCRAEGVDEPDGLGDYDTWQDGYFELWDRINGAGAAASNPWVWVIGFRRTA